MAEQDPPIIDIQNTSVETVVSRREIEDLPISGRNFMSLVLLAPGVTADRRDVGGSEIGNVQSFSSQGATITSNQFLVDGVDVTDLTSAGSSPNAFNLEAIEEFRVLTERYDAEYGRNAGAIVMAITRSGTNDFHGNAAFFTARSSQFKDNAFQNPGAGLYDGNNNFAASAGGPIRTDKVFYFVSYEGFRTKREVFAAGESTPADFSSNGLTGKLNWQLTPGHSLVGSYLGNDFTREGQGASEDRTPDATSVDDGRFFVFGATYRGRVSPNLLVEATGGANRVRFDSNPLGTGTPIIENGIFRNGFFSFDSERDSRVLSGKFTYIRDANWTFTAGGGSRSFDDTASTFVQGGSITSLDFSPSFPAAILPAQSNWRVGIKESWFFGQADWRVKPNLTLNLGVRWDDQSGENKASTVGANPLLPNLVPEASFAGNKLDLDGSGAAPRVGFAWDVTRNGRTVIRGGYGIYYDALIGDVIQRQISIGQDPFRGAAGFLFNDTTADLTWTPNESRGQEAFFGNVQTNSANFFATPNRIAAGLKLPRTNQWSIGFEREPCDDLVWGVNYTRRWTNDLFDETPIIDDGISLREFTRADAVPGVAFDGAGLGGNPFSQPTFRLNPAFSFTGGTNFLNGARERRYQGLDLTFNKRLANRWMLRGYFNVEKSDVSVPDSFFQDPNDLRGGADNDGGPNAETSASIQKRNVFLNSSWSGGVYGMYQIAPDLKHGFDLSANLYTRRGFPMFPFSSFDSGDGETREIELSDDARYDNLFVTDLRVSKNFTFSDFGLTLGLDVFNAFNKDTVVQQNVDTQSNAFLSPIERLSPRTFQFSGRFRF